MPNKEPSPERAHPLPPLDFEDSLTRAAFKGRRFEDLPVGRFGGRLAAIPTTIIVPDSEYYGDPLIEEQRAAGRKKPTDPS